MTMLGPGMILIGSPAAFGWSIIAVVRALDRPFGIAALVLSSLELTAIAAFVISAALV
jgi:hypothetical protein